MTQIVHSPNPLIPTADRKIHTGIDYREGETIGQMIRRAGISIDHTPVHVRLNGRPIVKGLLDQTPVQETDHIEIRAAVEGGDGSNVLAIVLSIVLIVVAPYLAPALAGVLGVSTTVATGLIMVGGSLLIGALFPPKAPSFGGGGENTSPTYNLQGGSNQPRPFQPLPIILGTTKIIPDLAAAPFVEFEGKDQIMFQSFNFGLSDVDLTDFKIGQTPLGDFEEATYEVSGATGVLTKFPGNVDTVAGAELRQEDGWIGRTTSVDAIAIGIDMQGVLFQTDKKGRFRNLSITLQIEYRLVGTGEWQNFADYEPSQPQYPRMTSGWQIPIPQLGGGYGVTISNGSTDPVRRMYYREVPEGQYEVRIRRLTKTFSDDKQKGDLTWAALRTYQKDGADYSGQKRMGVRIRASGQLNGRIEELSAIASAKIPVWNGSSWVVQASSNPAWQYLYIARGKKNASNQRLFGAGLPDSRIDVQKIMEWAAWCDSKNLQCNIVFDQKMNVQDMLTTIARCGRGSISFAPGKLSVVYDKENLPITQMFGMSNIRAGSFTVDYISDKLADEIIINFVNPELNWQLDSVKARSPGVTIPENTVSYDIAGITNKDQAGREANLQAARQLFNRRRVSFETDAEALVCARGDVISVSHDLTQWSQSGRLVSGTTTQLVLDRDVAFNELTQPYISVRYPNGSIQTVAVQVESEPTNTLTLLAPIGTSPNDDTEDEARNYIYQFSPVATPGRKLKIVHMEHLGSDGNHIKIIAQDEVAAYYDAEDGEYEYIPPSLINTGVAQITNLTITEESISNVTDAVRIVASWQMTQAQGARVRVAKHGEDFKDYGEVYGNTFSFDVTEPTTITVEVSPLAIVKTKQTFGVVTQQYTIRGLGALPEDIKAVIPRVNGLELFGGANATEFTGNDAKFVWRKVAGSAYELGSEAQGGDSGGEDPYFKDYEVKILNPGGSVRRTEYVKDNMYVYSWEKNFEDGAVRSFTIEVRGRGIHNQVSAQPARLTVSNPAPQVPNGITIQPIIRNAFLSYTIPTDPDFRGVIAWLSTVSGFTPSDLNKVFDGNSNNAALNDLAPGTQYYLRIAGYDAFGKTGLNVSSEFAFETNLIESIDLDIGIIEEINIADAAVTLNKIADEAISANKLVDGSVIEAKLAAGAVSTSKIQTNAITETLISDDAITTPKIAANAITANEIQAGAVVAGKIAANAVTANELTAGSVTTLKLAALAVTAATIATNAITSDKINAGAVIAGKIAASAITANELASNSVTTLKLAANAVEADKIAANAVTADKIAANSVTAGKILANSITADRLLVGTITAASGIIANAAISTANIQDSAITNAKIGFAAIAAANIQDLTVGTIKIANNAISLTTAGFVGSGSMTSFTQGSYQAIASATIPSTTNGVLVTISVDATVSGSASTFISARIRRHVNGTYTTLWEGLSDGGSTYKTYGQIKGSFTILDAPPGGGFAHTYYLEISGSGGTSAYYMRSGIITTEMKK